VGKLRWGASGAGSPAGIVYNAISRMEPDALFTPSSTRCPREVVADLGFSALKFDLDVPTPYMQDTASGTLGRAEVRAMVDLAAAVIDAVSDDVDTRGAGRRRPGSASGNRRRRRPAPDRDGRERYLRHGVREAFESGAIDIAAPDLQKTGRLLEGRRIADYADTHYVSVAPHSIASPIGTVAAVHVAAAVPNSLALEWHGMSVPFWEDLAAGWDGKVIEGGRIRVPDGPGARRRAQPRHRAPVRARGRAVLRRRLAARCLRRLPWRVRMLDLPRQQGAAVGAGRGFALRLIANAVGQAGLRARHVGVAERACQLGLLHRGRL
jgi:hypothetical protein